MSTWRDAKKSSEGGKIVGQPWNRSEPGSHNGDSRVADKRALTRDRNNNTLRNHRAEGTGTNMYPKAPCVRSRAPVNTKPTCIPPAKRRASKRRTSRNLSSPGPIRFQLYPASSLRSPGRLADLSRSPLESIHHLFPLPLCCWIRNGHSHRFFIYRPMYRRGWFFMSVPILVLILVR